MACDLSSVLLLLATTSAVLLGPAAAYECNTVTVNGVTKYCGSSIIYVNGVPTCPTGFLPSCQTTKPADTPCTAKSLVTKYCGHTATSFPCHISPAPYVK